MDLITLSQQRYTTKLYDPSKKIPADQFKQLCTLLRNSPSSVNSQPWHFVVAHSDAAKAKILPAIAEFNHKRINDASHIIIFCVRTDMSENHLHNLLAQEEKDGRFSAPGSKEGSDSGRHYFVGLNNQTSQDLLAWEGKQAYLALGTLLFGAASLGIDSTPMEGFDPQKLNGILGLPARGFTSQVIASLGYHSDNDFNKDLPKSRLPEEQIFTFMP